MPFPVHDIYIQDVPPLAVRPLFFMVRYVVDGFVCCPVCVSAGCRFGSPVQPCVCTDCLHVSTDWLRVRTSAVRVCRLCGISARKFCHICMKR